MTNLAIAFPAEAAAPIAQAVAGAARPVLGVGMFAAMLMLFKPLLAAVACTARRLVSPGMATEQRARKARLKNAFRLQKLARDHEDSEPGLAAELRALAARA